MFYSPLTNKAARIAYDAHLGQVDKSGLPYVFHPWHVAEQMDGEYATCAALLHDVIEDTAVTLAELEAEFPPEVTEAVALLTHKDGVAYMDYVDAIAGNEIARQVKLADLAHNLDETRFAGATADTPSAEARARQRAKYLEAQARLLKQGA